MNEVVEILKIILPAGLVMYAMFLVMRSFLNKEYDRMKLEASIETRKQTLPLQVQGLERMAIFLERITPNNLLVRVSESGMMAKDLQNAAVNDVREEFEHNLSQQVFVSSELWESIRNAKEEVITILNIAMGEMEEKATALDLGHKVSEIIMAQGQNPTDVALSILRAEAKQLF